MPFKSKAQMKAAFGGYLGPKMKAKAEEWAKETPNIKALPEHKSKVVSHSRTVTNKSGQKKFVKVVQRRR